MRVGDAGNTCCSAGQLQLVVAFAPLARADFTQRHPLNPEKNKKKKDKTKKTGSAAATQTYASTRGMGAREREREGGRERVCEQRQEEADEE